MVTSNIETCRHGRSIIQVCDQCVALSDAPMPTHIHTYIGLPSMCSCGASAGETVPRPDQICTACGEAPAYWRWRDPWEASRFLCNSCFNAFALPEKHPEPDPINHPPHYTQHPSGVECITITEHYNFNVGNAIKYLWRAGLKDGADAADDLAKAAWYVQREIDRPIQPTEATVYCGLCLASLTSPFCPNQSCPQSPLYVLTDPPIPTLDNFVADDRH